MGLELELWHRNKFHDLFLLHDALESTPAQGHKTYPESLLSSWVELYFSGPSHNADFTEGQEEKGWVASAGREVGRGEYLTVLPILMESAEANGRASSYIPGGNCKT